MTDIELDLRCSPWTLAQGVDPIGTTPAFEALVFVEWPRPWPADVSDVPELAAAAGVSGARVMMVAPHSDTTAGGLTRVVHRRRTAPNHLVGVDHLVGPGSAADLVAAIAAQPQADSSTWPSAIGDSPPEVLICAHGRRDRCCGRWGTLLHAELLARSCPARVWRSSHTGGHRFAPTAITLPDGRAWAYTDAEMLEGIVNHTADVRALAGHDRGSSALLPWAQVLERAVFDHIGWSWFAQAGLTAQIDTSADGQQAVVTLRWEEGWARGEVAISRHVPVLRCGEAPGASEKTCPDYELRSFEIA